MKISIYSILTIFLLLFFSACNKDEIDDLPVENDPVFEMKGTMNGESFQLVAGESNAYMYTFTEEVNNVSRYSGKISDGNTEIEIGFYNGNNDLPVVFSFDNLPSQNILATLPNQPLAKLNKNNFLNASMIEEVEWFANSVLIGIDSADIYEPGIYEICANVTYSDGGQGSVCNTIMLGYQQNANFKLNHLIKQNGEVQAWVDVISGSVQQVEWILDGEHVSADAIFSEELEDGGSTISAKVTFTNGVVKTKSIYVDVDESWKFIQDFTYFETSSLNSTLWDHKMVIRYKRNGTEYRSDFSGNQSGTLTVEEVKYYGKNAEGNSVFILSGNVSANLKNMSTSQVVPIQFTTKFGIEIK